MQEIKKRRIVLASLLKPVDDTRMYGKLGLTLASTYEVHIIGQASKSTPTDDNIRVIPLPAHGRVNYRRLFAPWHVLWATLRIKPHLLIVCTAELLPIALCVRMLFGAKVIYDVQENYAQNIRYGHAWPRVLQPILALGVRMVEWCSSLFISHFLLAEQSYADELKFIRNNFTIVENKLARTVDPRDRVTNISFRQSDSQPIRLLFTGTLAETTGVFAAIALAKKLHEVDNNICLLVIGYAAQSATRTAIEAQTRGCKFIELVGIDHLIPHRRINEAVRNADFGIISYPRNLSTWNSRPTKLFEYLGNHLPILLIDNPKWVSVCATYSAAVVFPADESLWDATLIRSRMRTQSFYPIEVTDVFWDSEARKLLLSVSRIITDH